MRQKKLARYIVDDANSDSPRSKGELVESVGYSKQSSLKKPGEIISSKGTQLALKALGFHEDAAKEVVQEILHNEANEPMERLAAAREVFKVMGSYAAEKSFNLTATASVEELREEVLKDMSKWQGNKP